MMNEDSGDRNMTKLPAILAEQFNADYVEDIALDVRLSVWDSFMMITQFPSRFPNANFNKIEQMMEAISDVHGVWFND